MALNFGYNISKPRVIDIDRNNLRKSVEIIREYPEEKAEVFMPKFEHAMQVAKPLMAIGVKELR